VTRVISIIESERRALVARVRERFCSLSSSLLLFPIFFSFIARANEFTFLCSLSFLSRNK
jgi:hypothetical protein